MVEEIKKYRKEGSSLGGVYEIIVTGVPVELGSYTHWDRKLNGEDCSAILGTQAMKGVEIGIGFEAGTHGQEVHDEITHDGNIYICSTNRAGGIEGGMSTGMPLIIRGSAMKPIPTMLNPLGTVDMHS